MQTRNISWAAGENRKVAKLSAIRRSTTSTGSAPSSPRITSPVRLTSDRMTASKSCRLSGK